MPIVQELLSQNKEEYFWRGTVRNGQSFTLCNFPCHAHFLVFAVCGHVSPRTHHIFFYFEVIYVCHAFYIINDGFSSKVLVVSTKAAWQSILLVNLEASL